LARLNGVPVSSPRQEAFVDFDYSTPEAQAAMVGITSLIRELQGEIDRKTLLYERTLGLAVAPVLARRAAIVLFRRYRVWRQGIR
jgi:hypothetical protein